MATDTFTPLAEPVTAAANAAGQLGSLAHLYVHCLERTARSDDEPVLAATRLIRQRVLPYTAADGVGPRSNKWAFQPDRAAADFARFVRGRPGLPPQPSDQVLVWLLEGEFTDATRKNCDLICRRNRVTAETLFPPTTAPAGSALGFGEIVSDATAAGPPLVNRDNDLDKHLGFLTQCVRQRRHYLLEGHAGVGKSCFARALVARALGRWAASTEERLRETWFVFLGPHDFVGSEEEIKARLDHLYAYLQKRPSAVPVFDGLEHLLNRSLVTYNLLAARFGAVLSGGGRTFALVCQSGPAGAAELLKTVKAYPLAAMTSEAAKPIIADRLREALAARGPKWGCEPDAETFINTLLNLARERYPGRALPGVAVHLVESAALRAENRVLFLDKKAKPRVTVDDLWQHVSDEQGINPETFGTNPADFYARLRADLKTDVLCQDHAIELVGRELEFQAGRPPQRAPRGRFLFAGPPGVGKTELARSLAHRLGMGDEAFFIFNMSEYSTDAARTRFMGADPGYVGFRATRTIYDQVRARPSCVILLDEIDRADPSIQDILLSILEGQGKDAEGSPVYFSQAVFVMTTNQGQQQVREAHAAAVAAAHPHPPDRDALARKFDDAKLRGLLLKGVLDETEAGMKAFLSTQTAAARERFAAHATAKEGYRTLRNYLALKDTARRMEATQRRPPLDPALLDRIDFIVPFFPIKERDGLARILDQKLARFGWPECDGETRDRILDDALAQDESVRPLERLIKKYYAAWSEAAARAAKRGRGRK